MDYVPFSRVSRERDDDSESRGTILRQWSPIMELATVVTGDRRVSIDRLVVVVQLPPTSGRLINDHNNRKQSRCYLLTGPGLLLQQALDIGQRLLFQVSTVTFKLTFKLRSGPSSPPRSAYMWRLLRLQY